MAQLSTSHVFISYSRRDEIVMQRVVGFLRKQGINVWLDNEKLVPGTPIWEAEIEKAIFNAGAVVVLLSPDSKNSPWVRREISYAEDYDKRIFPILVAGNQKDTIPIRLTNHQRIDIRENEEVGLNSLSVALSFYLENLETQEKSKQLVNEKQFVPPKKTDHEAIKEIPGVTVREIKKIEPGTTVTIQTKSIWSRFLLTGITSIIVIALFICGYVAINLFQGATPTTVPSRVSEIPIATNTPNLGIGSSMISADGATLVYIPAGKFTMGSDYGSPNELPVHNVYLEPFWMDQTEVTNEMYAKCVEAGLCETPSNIDHFSNSSYANHPVVFVDWYKANAYCSWAERHLPTEAEWEKAASWDEANQTKLLFPWGNSLNYDCSLGNFYNYTQNRACINDTTPVASYELGRTPYGTYDTAGNVWEWVSSLFMPYPYILNDGREYVNTPGKRVIRGGSWKDYSYYDTRSIIRYMEDPLSSNDSIGFRCARSP